MIKLKIILSCIYMYGLMTYTTSLNKKKYSKAMDKRFLLLEESLQHVQPRENKVQEANSRTIKPNN